MLEKKEIKKKAINILNTFLKINNGNITSAKNCSIYLIDQLIAESFKLDLRYFKNTYNDLCEIRIYLQTL